MQRLAALSLVYRMFGFIEVSMDSGTYLYAELDCITYTSEECDMKRLISVNSQLDIIPY